MPEEPVSGPTSTCSFVQPSMLSDLTLDICVPSLRWIDAHRMHRKMPNYVKLVVCDGQEGKKHVGRVTKDIEASPREGKIRTLHDAQPTCLEG